MNFEPGTAFTYSNSGYFILGEVVRKVSGKSLAQFARDEIFLPLGMTHTLFMDSHARVIPGRAASYVPGPGGRWAVSSSNWEDMGPGGVQTTLDDLARWDAEFHSPKVLGKGVIDGLQTPGRLTSGNELAYASGLVIEGYRGVRRVQHAGGTSGYRAMLARYPDQATSVILLCNAGNANPYLLTDQITDVVLEGQLPKGEPKLAPASAILPAGLYWSLAEDEYQQVSVDGGTLRFGPPGRQGVVLDAYDDGVFRKRPRTTQTFRVEAGSPPRLMVRDGTGHEQVFRRVDPVAPSPAELADFVGHYTSYEVAAHYDVRLTDGRLVVHLGGSDPLLPSGDGDEILVPTSRDAFSIGGLGVRFLREKGRVTAMTISPSRAARVRFTKSLVDDVRSRMLATHRRS